VDPELGSATGGDSDPAYEVSPRGKTLLQERLATYGIVVASVATAYWPGFYFIWRAHPGVTEESIFGHIFSPWTFVLLALHASFWVVCRGKPVPHTWLPAMDVVVHAAVGFVYGRILLSHPAPVVVPLEGLLALASVLGMRALLVPSSGARTALVGVCMCLGPGLTLLLYPAHFSAPWMGVRTSGPLFVNWAVVAIVLTSVASKVLYGLRREVRDAKRFGQYTLVERLGEGGMGVVYRAEHALLRRPTAVKLLPPTTQKESVIRFEREVQLMAELNHPNTVAVYDYGRTADGVFYYAMEYLDGIDLEGLVEVGGPQPAPRVIHLLRQICGSLDEAHRRGLIHRDVKPANMFLCRKRAEPDTIKVLDFGLVKDIMADDPSLSVADLVLGTPLYMSPEAFTDPKTVDARSDLYSLGAVAYMLLTGTPVFSGGSLMDVFSKHLGAVPESMSQRLGQPVPADLEAVVFSCLAKEKSQRPESARALRDALDACADAHGWHARDVEEWWSAHAKIVDQRQRTRARDGASTGTTVVIGLSRTIEAEPGRGAGQGLGAS
jgi:eukaryotic-like serine/threonine-protein kinase